MNGVKSCVKNGVKRYKIVSFCIVVTLKSKRRQNVNISTFWRHNNLIISNKKSFKDTGGRDRKCSQSVDFIGFWNFMRKICLKKVITLG